MAWGSNEIFKAGLSLGSLRGHSGAPPTGGQTAADSKSHPSPGRGCFFVCLKLYKRRLVRKWPKLKDWHNSFLVSNRNRNSWQIGSYYILYVRSVHILCIWLHDAATICLLHQRLADAAAGTDATRGAVCSSLVVSFACAPGVPTGRCLLFSLHQGAATSHKSLFGLLETGSINYL